MHPLASSSGHLAMRAARWRALLTGSLCAAMLCMAGLAGGCSDDTHSPTEDAMRRDDGAVHGDGSGDASNTRDAAAAGDAADGAAAADTAFAGDGQPADVSTDGSPACRAAFAGCSTFIDATAPSASREIVFTDFAYAPSCLEVKAGQQVTFRGKTASDTFVRHPLRQSCGPAVILEASGSSIRTQFTMSTPGIYGYYCLDHGSQRGQAMAGAIQVVF